MLIMSAFRPCAVFDTPPTRTGKTPVPIPISLIDISALLMVQSISRGTPAAQHFPIGFPPTTYGQLSGSSLEVRSWST
jgi:hypothetical protein